MTPPSSARYLCPMPVPVPRARSQCWCQSQSQSQSRSQSQREKPRSGARCANALVPEPPPGATPKVPRRTPLAVLRIPCCFGPRGCLHRRLIGNRHLFNLFIIIALGPACNHACGQAAASDGSLPCRLPPSDRSAVSDCVSALLQSDGHATDLVLLQPVPVLRPPCGVCGPSYPGLCSSSRPSARLHFPSAKPGPAPLATYTRAHTRASPTPDLSAPLRPFVTILSTQQQLDSQHAFVWLLTHLDYAHT